MEMRGMMGGLYRVCEWIMRLSVINLLWILTSLPVWYLLLVLLTAPGVEDYETFFMQTFILIGILSPFTLFPSTSAMFSVARKWVMGDTDVPLLKTFFRSYRQNYRQAMLGGLLYTVLFAVLIFDYRMYAQDIGGLGFLSMLFLFLIFLLLVSLLHFFSLLAHFHMGLLKLIRNALLLTVGRPFRTLMMALFCAGMFWFSAQFTFLIPFFTGSVIALGVYYNFHVMLDKIMEKAEQQQKARGDGENGGDALEAEESRLMDEVRDKRA
ncbi:MAG: hypothetical protein BAA02_10810 [Paenibacillaceae bacterium ZCTH02-B3]|nr:MAG: hypothetical protein BAA02_10810 [Paenibacillaceae bacterium ZCTH02-B3]